MLCVSFLGWDSRHNMWMDPPKADEAAPQIVFEPPAARRRAPERLFDEVQAQGPRMAVESTPNPRSCTGPGTPGTGERPHLALKRQRTSALSGAVRVVEGAHVGATGDVLDAASGYYRVALHGRGGQVFHFRSVQLVAIAAAAPGSDGGRVSGRGGGSGNGVTAAAAGGGGRAGGGGGGGGGRHEPSRLQPTSSPRRTS